MASLEQPERNRSPSDPHSSSMAPPKILLNILSPSEEVRHRLSFPSTSLSMTVGQLKEKIRDAVDTHPAPERQRLIYQGRPLSKDSDTLQLILGKELNTELTYTFHLVLPPRSTIMPSNSQRIHPLPLNYHQPLRPTPASTTNVAHPSSGPIPVPSTQAPTNHGVGHIPNMTGAQQMPPSAGHPFAAVNQQLAQQIHQQIQEQMLPQMIQQIQRQTQTSQQAVIQQLLGQRQQARATAGLNGIGQPAPPGAPTQTQEDQQQQTRSQPIEPVLSPPEVLPQAIPMGSTPTPDVRTIVRSGRNPDGTFWQYTSTNRTTIIPPPGVAQAIPNSGSTSTPSLTQMMNSPPVAGTNPPLPTGNPIAPQPWSADAPGYNEARQLLSEIGLALSSLDHQMAIGRTPSDEELNRLRSLVERAYHVHDIPVGHWLDTLDIRNRVQNIITRIQHTQNHPEGNSENSTPNIMPQHTLSPPLPQGAGVTPASVYLLSSPNGPYALLFAPSGVYTGAPTVNLQLQNFQAPTAQTQPPPLNPAIAQHFAQHQAQYQARHQPAQVQAQLQQVQQLQLQLQGQPLQQGQQQPQEQQGQPQQQQQPPQARQPGRGLVQTFFGHIWLLVRLMGFLLFFATGSDLPRSIVLTMIALVVFLTHLGFFEPIRDYIWRSLRQYLRDQVNDEERAQNGRQPANQEGDRRPRGEPRPHEMAERLIRERNEREASWVQRNFHRAERAMIIFIGSLIPGVGEMHVRAQEEADMRRQRARADEERRREAEQRQVQAPPEDSGEANISTMEPSDPPYANQHQQQEVQANSAAQPIDQSRIQQGTASASGADTPGQTGHVGGDTIQRRDNQGPQAESTQT
ncbi:MAG: hypothetical protein M1834_003774 [Cirrosporium novae-zelandiae]|nr:MAG: hypothetical protein M1834_003774 [Cirrosporium novae-zelandiae]